MSEALDAHAVLRRYWGYDSFRPMQERIVASLVAGHDTCVVMPTGGGKSLCYQLPAAMRPDRMVVVVSPLIALMQDQVAQLTQMGIPAALLNSSIANDEQNAIMGAACRGEYRLLYLSPERLARPDTAGWLRRAPVSMFAIDEAHCISEWGHEFRPEYRNLSSLRALFPGCPLAAFTASATRRVRHDILDQLQLRAPHKYIASFHRANLRYVVSECPPGTQPRRLLRALRHYDEGNVIVYAPTINAVEQTCLLLERDGIAAIPYHGKMDTKTRRDNQERWMNDDVRVLVGTLAFGLGINKAAVRAVIHLSLPKSIEQYYQEAGRAGRDGEPSDCLLLWQKRDAGLLAHFVEQIADGDEKQRAWQRYHGIRNFAESATCRHRQICTHFGERSSWENCGACDHCGYQPGWMTTPDPAPARRRRQLSARAAAAAPPPSATSPFPAPAAAPAAAPRRAKTQGPLADALREWRLATARRLAIPAFIVMHDRALDDLCRLRPRDLGALLEVPGFGERKVERFGEEIVALIVSHGSS